MPVPAVSDSQILLHGNRGRPKADKKQKVREISDFTNFLEKSDKTMRKWGKETQKGA